MKRKPKYIPGLGAVVSQRVTQTLALNRKRAAARFIEHSRLAIRGDYAGNFPRNHWTGLAVVQIARARYNAAALADLYRRVA